MEGGLWDTGMCILQYRGVSLLSRVQKNSSFLQELFFCTRDKGTHSGIAVYIRRGLAISFQ